MAKFNVQSHFARQQEIVDLQLRANTLHQFLQTLDVNTQDQIDIMFCLTVPMCEAIATGLVVPNPETECKNLIEGLEQYLEQYIKTNMPEVK